MVSEEEKKPYELTLIPSPYVTPCCDIPYSLFNGAVTRANITAAIDERTTTLFIVIWYIL
jgi:hypothetical protein